MSVSYSMPYLLIWLQTYNNPRFREHTAGLVSSLEWLVIISYVFVARSWRYSAKSTIEKSACKKLRSVVLGYFLFILNELFVRSAVCGFVYIDPGFVTRATDWSNAYHKQQNTDERREIAVQSEEGVQLWISCKCLVGRVVYVSYLLDPAA